MFLFQDSSVETVILVSPKFGVSQISSLRNTVVSVLHYFILVTSAHRWLSSEVLALLSLMSERESLCLV